MFRNRKMRRVSIVVFWILIWSLLAWMADNPILLVTPSEAVLRLLELSVKSDFWYAIAGSLLRIGVGFFSGFAAALLLAGISLRHPFAEELLQPLMSLIKTIPVVSFVVLLLIWWGSSVLAAAISFLVVLPNIYMNTLEGLKNADVRLLEMARVFRMSGRNRFFYIYRPALQPFLKSGMKISLGMCWKSGVAAEVIGMPEFSIGGQLYFSKIHLDTAGVLAWTVVIVLISVCFEKLILWLADRFFAWNPAIKGHKSKEADKKDAAGENNRRISVSHLRKAYGGKQVLSDVSAVYEAGKTYYLTSPSGSGKTTLLRMLCGLEKPDGGRMEGAERYSMVFQEDRLCEEFDAVCNVAMVIKDEQKAKEALRKLLEEDALTKPCRQLSGGMKRRVALVRAMEADSDAVLLDEPFTGMDADTRRAAEIYIRERQNARIVIIATHI